MEVSLGLDLKGIELDMKNLVSIFPIKNAKKYDEADDI